MVIKEGTKWHRRSNCKADDLSRKQENIARINRVHFQVNKEFTKKVSVAMQDGRYENKDIYYWLEELETQKLIEANSSKSNFQNKLNRFNNRQSNGKQSTDTNNTTNNTINNNNNQQHERQQPRVFKCFACHKEGHGSRDSTPGIRYSVRIGFHFSEDPRLVKYFKDEGNRNIYKGKETEPLDHSRPFHVYVDASNVGCVITQRDEGGNEQPVVYHLKKFYMFQRSCSTTERELLALIVILKS
ncbi:hypothetical protein ACTA71_011829 [Dictyostelium dimigraforme]